MNEARSTREKLLQAALDVLAEEGARAVTHRSVEERAGVARGSTRYHFGTLALLFEALIEECARRDMVIALAAQQQLGGLVEGNEAGHTADLRPVMNAIAAGLLADRQGALARFELFLYAARRPELAAAVDQWASTFVDLGEPLLQAAGDPDPRATASALAAGIDGLVLHSLFGGRAARPALEVMERLL